MPLNNPSADVVMNTGWYGGVDSVNRAIAHGLIRVPKLVLIVSSQGSHYVIWFTSPYIDAQYGTGETEIAVTAMDSTYFYVGNAASYFSSANAYGVGYRFVAIS